MLQVGNPGILYSVNSMRDNLITANDLTMIFYFLCTKITDKKKFRRRFSFLTYNLEKLPSINANMARIPLKLEECWNTLEINLQAFCRMTYGTDYEALQRMIVYSNCRLRRVYLQDRHYDHNEISIELCNMFFNTYMSKWKVNFIEKTCQTEDYHTGFIYVFNMSMKYIYIYILIIYSNIYIYFFLPDFWDYQKNAT